MTELNLEAERALFEAWMRKDCGADDVSLALRENGKYEWGRTCDMHAAWLAARRAVPAQAGAPTAELMAVAEACVAQGCTAAMEDWIDAQSPPQGELRTRARTEQMIVDQTEQLAAALAEIDGYQLAGNYRDTSAPRGRAYWIKACLAQEILTSTDPENAVAELGAPNQPEASADKLALTEGQMRTLQRAANALECCEYEDTAGDLRAIIATLKGQQR